MMKGDGADDVDAAVEQDEFGGRDQSWDDLAEAPLEFDPSDPICGPCEDQEDVIVDSDGEEFQVARGAARPKAPSREAQMRHNLTHLPYASWCPWCVMGRKANAPHYRSKSGSDRSLPLLVADYAFVRDKDDAVPITQGIGLRRRLKGSRRPLRGCKGVILY